MSGLRPPAGAAPLPLRPAAAGIALSLLACWVICAASAAQPSVALASESQPSLGGFSAVPGSFSASEPVTRSYFRPRIDSGGSVREEALLRNSSAHSLTLLVYPVEGLTGVTSGAVYSSRGVALHGPGRWVTPAVGRITLAPGQRRRVAFTARVPRGTPPGEHLAGIAFQNVRPSRSGGRFAITQIVRIVIGIEVIVPGPAASQLDLEGASLGALGGTSLPAVILRLRNSGRLLCTPTVSARLRGPEGALSAPVTRRLEAILPGDAIPYPLPWPTQLPAGSYRIGASAVGCGQPVRLQVAASLGEALGGGAFAPFATNSRSTFPWAALAAACGGAAALSLALLLLVRRRERRRMEVAGAGDGRWL